MKLKPVNPASRAEVARLVRFVNSHYESAVPLTADAARAKRFFWVLDPASGELAGVTGYVELTPHLAETVKTVVAPGFRGKGLGTRISQAIEDEVRRQGFGKIRTTIYADNVAMVVIKLRQGYRFEGFHPSHEAPGFDEYSLGKLLKAGSRAPKRRSPARPRRA